MNKKKANMAYWDEIDELAEEYVRNLIAFSTEKTSLYKDDDDAIMELGKAVTEFATKLLKERISAEFPYVDEDY